MSIIKEIVKRQTGHTLTEALRIGNKEMSAVFQNQSKFRVGLEFEFEVTEGVDFITAIQQRHNAAGPKQEEYRTKVAGFINKLSGFVIKAKLVDLEDISMIASDFQTAGEDGVGYLLEVNFDEALRAFSIFFNCVANSVSLSKVEHTEELIGFGMWGGSIQDPIINKIKFVQANRSTFMSMVEREQVKFAHVFGDVLEAFVEYVENDCESVPDIIQKDKLYRGMLNIVEQSFAEENPDDYKEPQKSKIDVVKDTHPLDPSLVQDIVPDITVTEGAELVTVPLALSDLKPVLEQMSSYIKNVGGTSRNTGLHVNISIKNMDSVNTAKFITLIDTDFFQNMSPSGLDKVKYDPRYMVEPFIESLNDNIEHLAPRYMVEPFIESLNDNIEHLASVYVFKGQGEFFQEYERVINNAAKKERNVNLTNFFSKDVKASERRIEIRAIGGQGYENRVDEIYNDIIHFLYVLMVATDNDFERRKYQETTIRWLNRVSGGRFMDLIQQNRRKMM